MASTRDDVIERESVDVEDERDVKPSSDWKHSNEDGTRTRDESEGDGRRATTRAYALASESESECADDGSASEASGDSHDGDEMNEREGEGEGEGEGEWGDGGEGGGRTRTTTQRALVARRLKRARDLRLAYEEQYWVLLEKLRAKHGRFALRRGHDGSRVGGEKANEERDRAGLSRACVVEDCERCPMALTNYCFKHIARDEKQVLYIETDGRVRTRSSETPYST